MNRSLDCRPAWKDSYLSVQRVRPIGSLPLVAWKVLAPLTRSRAHGAALCMDSSPAPGQWGWPLSRAGGTIGIQNPRGTC